MRAGGVGRSSASGCVPHRDGDGFLLPDQHDQPLAARDAGVEKVPLQHSVVLRHDRNDYGGIFRALAFMNEAVGSPFRSISRLEAENAADVS